MHKRITRIYSEQTFELGEPVKELHAVQFMIGGDGPFTVRVAATPGWEQRAQQLIDEKVRELQALRS